MIIRRGSALIGVAAQAPLGRFATVAGKGLQNPEEVHMMHIPSNLPASARMKKTSACSPESTELKRRTNN